MCIRDRTKVQLNFGLSLYLDHKFGLSLSLGEITLLFDLSLYLERSLAQQKAQRKAKSRLKDTQFDLEITKLNHSVNID